MAEDVFAQARDAAGEAEELLVDDDWGPVEVDPEAVEVNGNGNGQGSDIFGPTIELVRVDGHAPVLVSGDSANGNHDDDESQRSLFSWAEFMDEEPSKPKRCKSKLQPASMSMFEWAFEQEREREAESIGARR